MFERYSESARKAVFFARYEASQCGSPEIEPEHLLLGILREDAQLAQLISRRVEEAIRERVSKQYEGKKRLTTVDLPLSTASKQALAYAEEQARELKQNHIGPEHMLLGLLCDESSTAARILRERGVTPARLRDEAIHRAAERIVNRPVESRPVSSPLRDMVREATERESIPLVGREREMERIIQILSRRTKNNAVLVGEAGVGKTAIVEGLAQRVAEGTVPLLLQARRLVAVDASSLVASNERDPNKFDDVLGELTDPANTILFVRGLFNLAAAGPAWAAVEAMHALEPLLAHGELQCIATGSPHGLRQTIEKAGMLARHFEVVNVAPVSVEEAIRIVSGLKLEFERFHGVTFAPGAIEAAVHASGRFLPDRHLPDRAIDLIDEAAAAVKLRSGDKASNTVTTGDITATIAARTGATVEAIERVMQMEASDELERIAGELAATVPSEAQDWLPFLAAYLARCSAAEARALAQAIVAAKAKAKAQSE
jgi:ATP-dependent Clp protease ATP-binding subunit ClpC